MRALLYIFTLCLFALSNVPNVANAQSSEPDHYVQFSAKTETNHIKGGDEIWIALEQKLYPEWHSYWINPGDSGSPTRITWELPNGFTATPLQWPTPHKIAYGPLLNYGYEGTVTALQKLIAPADLPQGEITLKGQAEALVCKDICIPEYSEVSITLNAEGVPHLDMSSYFNDARDALPQQSDINGVFSQDAQNFILTLNNTDLCSAENPCTDIALFPYEWGLVDNTAAPVAAHKNNALTILQRASAERDISEVTASNFVLRYKDASGETHSLKLRGENSSTNPATAAIVNMVTPEASKDIAPTTKVASISFGSALLLALLGGLVLNLMPCVFPVLSLKALSLVKLSEKEGSAARIHGLAYTAGIILSFLAIAALLIALKSFGAQIGWGFQLQNPLVVSLLAYLLFIVGLNLAGLFEFANPFGNAGAKLTANNNASGSFFTGILATLVATPCTAPFMAAALGYALVQPTTISLSVFAALGLGLALPFLALSFIPSLGRALPKPGAWMETFKQFLAFPMFASAAWLIWVMSKQASSIDVLGALLGMVALAFGLWLWSRLPAQGLWRFILKLLAIAALIAPLALLPSTQNTPEAQSVKADMNAMSQPFSYATLDEVLNTGNAPVFVEMTADWCITCKLNNATSINTRATKAAFAQHDVKYLTGDWTNQDAEITKYLQEFDRNGVPLYVYYAPRPDAMSDRPAPKILPQILTPNIIAKALPQDN